MEVWKDVVNYEHIYMVSSLGNVKRKERTIIVNGVSKKLKEKTTKTHYDDRGYKKIVLHINKKSFKTGVHRLVAMAFIPNLENKPQVNHINGIKHDNRIENLEWVTNQENNLHAVKNGLFKYRSAKRVEISKDDIILKFKSTKEACEFIG